MRSDLGDNVFTVSGLLMPEECLELIARGESIGFRPASVRTAPGPRPRPDIRDNDRAEFDDPGLAESLWRRCLPFLSQESEGGVAVGLDHHFRLYRYDAGQRFNRHKDGVTERSPYVRSRLTCLFYLNEGFVGGETVFYSDVVIGGLRREEMAVSPRTGAALFFLHERWHEGRAPEAGRKYVLRSDVFYRYPVMSPSD